MSLQSLEDQCSKMRQLMLSHNVSLESYTGENKQLTSLARDLLGLQTYENKCEIYNDPPTSGESSPCISERERESRDTKPSLKEVCDLLEDELSIEVDSDLSKLEKFREKRLSLVLEGNGIGEKDAERMASLMKKVRTKHASFDRIFDKCDTKVIFYRGSFAYFVDCIIRKPDCIFDYLKELQKLAPLKASFVTLDKKKLPDWTAVVLRNLPESLSHEDLKFQTQRDSSGEVQVGPIRFIRGQGCCIIRTKFLEDAELLCKRLNFFVIKNPHTNQRYMIKAHLHPRSDLKHTNSDRSIFAALIPPKRTRINDLLEIFKSSKSEPPKVSKESAPTNSTNPGDVPESETKLEREDGEEDSNKDSSHHRKRSSHDRHKSKKHHNDDRRRKRQSSSSSSPSSSKHSSPKHNSRKYQHKRSNQDHDRPRQDRNRDNRERERERDRKDQPSEDRKDKDRRKRREKSPRDDNSSRKSDSRSRSKSHKRHHHKKNKRSKSRSSEKSERRSNSKDHKKARSKSNSKRKDRNREDRERKTTIFSYNYEKSPSGRENSRSKDRHHNKRSYNDKYDSRHDDRHRSDRRDDKRDDWNDHRDHRDRKESRRDERSDDRRDDRRDDRNDRRHDKREHQPSRFTNGPERNTDHDRDRDRERERDNRDNRDRDRGKYNNNRHGNNYKRKGYYDNSHRHSPSNKDRDSRDKREGNEKNYSNKHKNDWNDHENNKSPEYEKPDYSGKPPSAIQSKTEEPKPKANGDE